MKAIEQNIEKEIAQAVMEEQPMQPPAPKRKKRLTESTAAKVIAFLLMLVMTAVTAGGVLGAVFLYSADVYVTSETAFKQELFSNIAWGDGQMLLNFLIWNSEEQVYQMNTEAADSYCAERNISYVMVQDKTGRELWYTGLAEYDSPWQFRFSYDWANPERPSAGVVENAYTVRITVPLSSVFVYDDDYALANRLAELAYALRYWIYAIIAAAALLVTVCFIFLLCAAGHHPYVDGVRPGWGTRIPLDLLTAAVALGLFLGIQLVVEANFGGIGVVLAVVLGPAALAGVFTGWCMSLALRLKLGGWWRNTVVYVALRLLRRGGGAVLRALGSGLRGAAHGLAGLLHNVPLVGKTVLVFLGLCVLEGLGILFSMFAWSWGLLALLWIFEKLLLLLAVLALALMCRKLLLGGRALAAGDLSYQVDTSRMVLDFKSHGEDLNHIAQGMAAAVDQRMRSERMKTELITNVSHDIKTPIASIRAYSEALELGLARDEGERADYARTIVRKCDEVTSLTDDLFLHALADLDRIQVRCEDAPIARVVARAVADFDAAGGVTLGRLDEAQASCDPKRLEQALENLLANAAKYAPGAAVEVEGVLDTAARVYRVRVRDRGPGIPPEDLPFASDRFFRGSNAGDAPGAGLGLFIVRYLAEQMGGSLRLEDAEPGLAAILELPLAP